MTEELSSPRDTLSNHKVQAHGTVTRATGHPRSARLTDAPERLTNAPEPRVERASPNAGEA